MHIPIIQVLFVRANAIPILEKNIDKINWLYLSSNPNAISLIEQNLNEYIMVLSNPNAIDIIEQNLDNIIWTALWKNPNIFYSNKPTKEVKLNLIIKLNFYF